MKLHDLMPWAPFICLAVVAVLNYVTLLFALREMPKRIAAALEKPPSDTRSESERAVDDINEALERLEPPQKPTRGASAFLDSLEKSPPVLPSGDTFRATLHTASTNDPLRSTDATPYPKRDVASVTSGLREQVERACADGSFGHPEFTRPKKPPSDRYPKSARTRMLEERYPNMRECEPMRGAPKGHSDCAPTGAPVRKRTDLADPR